MKKRDKSIVLTILDIVVDSCAFIMVRYFIACCKHAFEESIVFMFLFSLDIYVIVEYWNKLGKNISNRFSRFLIIAVTIIILLILVFFVGYLKIMPVVERWQYA